MAEAYYPSGDIFVKWTPDMVGAAAANHTHSLQSMYYIGSNPISGDSDTVAIWGAKGVCYCFYSQTGLLIDQPSQWGLLLSFSTGGAEVHQFWLTQSSGSIWHRGGNSLGWAGTWKRIYDSTAGEVVISSTQPADSSNAKIWVKI